jgi:hypothetical protein
MKEELERIMSMPESPLKSLLIKALKEKTDKTVRK